MKVIIGLLSVKLSDKRIINQRNNARYLDKIKIAKQQEE